MKPHALITLVILALALAGCTSSFLTVTVSGERQKLESSSYVLATFFRSEGLTISNWKQIRGYNRYASSPENQLIRAWAGSRGIPFIYEFWREGRFVVLIDGGTVATTSRKYAEDLKALILKIDPTFDVIVAEQSYFDAT